MHQVGPVSERSCGAESPARAAVARDVLVAVQRGIVDAVDAADVVGRGKIRGTEGRTGERGLHKGALKGKGREKETWLVEGGEGGGGGEGWGMRTRRHMFTAPEACGVRWLWSGAL